MFISRSDLEQEVSLVTQTRRILRQHTPVFHGSDIFLQTFFFFLKII